MNLPPPQAASCKRRLSGVRRDLRTHPAFDISTTLEKFIEILVTCINFHGSGSNGNFMSFKVLHKRALHSRASKFARSYWQLLVLVTFFLTPAALLIKSSSMSTLCIFLAWCVFVCECVCVCVRVSVCVSVGVRKNLVCIHALTIHSTHNLHSFLQTSDNIQ
jgi:hypothetical protein